MFVITSSRAKGNNTIMTLTYDRYIEPGGGNPIYGLYRYVPRDRVWFLRFSVLK